MYKAGDWAGLGRLRWKQTKGECGTEMGVKVAQLGKLTVAQLFGAEISWELRTES